MGGGGERERERERERELDSIFSLPGRRYLGLWEILMTNYPVSPKALLVLIGSKVGSKSSVLGSIRSNIAMIFANYFIYKLN